MFPSYSVCALLFNTTRQAFILVKQFRPGKLAMWQLGLITTLFNNSQTLSGPSEANQCFCSSLLSTILVDLSRNRTFTSTSSNVYGFSFVIGGFWSICVSVYQGPLLGIAQCNKWLMAMKDTIVSCLLNVRFHVLLKITVIHKLWNKYYKMVLWFNFTFCEAMVSLVSPKHFHWTWLSILLLNKSLNSSMR